MKPQRCIAFKVLVTLVVGVSAAAAQDYPSKVIRIVATEAGSGSDIVSRLVASELTTAFGRQVIVDNRTSTIANETVAKAPPDGYTLLIQSSSLWLWPYLRSDSTWDALRDFSPVTLAIRQPNILVVHPSLPVKSVRELIALAKAQPGKLNYATGIIGATTHLAAELFNSMAGIKVVNVYYKGTASALTGLIAGQVEMMIANAASSSGHVKSGRLKALAVTTLQPTPLAPGLPTVHESGLPNYEAVTILGFFAPAGTPPAIVNRLSQEFARALHKPEIKEKLFNISVEAVGGPPDQLLAAVKMEMAKWGKVIKDSNIRLD